MTKTSRTELKFDLAAFSEQGPRSENQDAFATEEFDRSGIVAVADGMGGEKSGRVAADTALQALVESAPIRNLEAARRAVRQANERITQASESDPEQFGGMGCALGFLSLSDGGDGAGWIAAHVGDVRILSRSPDGLVRLETRDHTPAFVRWEAGEITLDEIPDSAGANRLQRAVGRGGEADVAWLPAAPGWSWLIVSDGIYKAMRLDELGAAMGAATARAGCEAIRRKVGERGADDNYTALLVRALGADGRAAATPPPKGAGSPMNESSTIPARPSRAAGGLASIVAILALALAGLAFWTARDARDVASDRVEIDLLRAEVDSLRAVISSMRDPFGPSAIPDTPAPAGSTTPQPSGP
jgi:PPM family protein phosphatase